ncbi:MAG: CAAD domain-containing protein [Microcoleaceae cyanobacterium MO_207.B10]|nr:CAAD domain-containing protein [Microcoleaceae cyanobacterium MO_207.B10]
MPQADPSKVKIEEETKNPPMDTTEAGTLATVPPSEQTNEQFQEIKDQILEILSELPAIVTGFFGQYQKPIITLGLILAAIITIKVMLAVVESLNDIPLLAPTFELIGIVYSAWFVYRYLLRASDRQQLLTELQVWKEQLLGDKSSNS